MKDNFNNKWDQYDTYNKGNIDEFEASPFVRDLFSSMAPPPKVEVNPYLIEDKKVVAPVANKDQDDSPTTVRSITSGGVTTTSPSNIALNKTEAAMPTPSPSASLNSTLPASAGTNKTVAAQLEKEEMWGV